MKRHMLTVLLTGYLYFGHYFGSSYTDLEYRPVTYRAGIHLDFSLADNTTLYVEDETLIVDNSETGFNPGQVNYKVGLIHKLNKVEIHYKHECQHPVDGMSRGAAAQSYNLVEVRYGF